MATSFARKMEERAGEIATLMESESRVDDGVPDWHREVNGRSNVKPFYSPIANLSADSCRVVFIADNPGGNPRNPDATTGPEYERFLNAPLGEYNAFIHEKWGRHAEGQAPMQHAVQHVFQVVFGAANWYRALTRSVCLNVCPLRTQKVNHVPCAVWVRCEAWSNRILDVVKPELILCCGNSDDYQGAIGKSPWASLRRRIDFGGNSVEQWSQDGVILKHGKFNAGSLRGVSVVGMRHLSTQKYVRATIDLLRGHLTDIEVPELIS